MFFDVIMMCINMSVVSEICLAYYINKGGHDNMYLSMLWIYLNVFDADSGNGIHLIIYLKAPFLSVLLYVANARPHR